jgi:hypothetical protein
MIASPTWEPIYSLAQLVETIIEKETGREDENNIVATSDDEDDEYYSDSDNQEEEVAESTLLKDSPVTTPPDGITVLPKALIDTSKNEPDPDPKFESTPKKQTNEMENLTNSTKSTSNVSKTTPLALDKRNISVPQITVDQIEDVGKDDKSEPDTTSNSNLLTTTKPNNDSDKRADMSPPIISGYSPTTSEDSDFTEELPEKLLKIQSEASLISSPNSKNVFIDKSYWELIGSAAVKMGWSKEILTTRLNNKALYKSNVVRNSKKLLMSQLGSNIDASYTGIGRPSQVETEEQLAFVLHLHDTISSVDINVKTTVKDKSQSTLRSYLKKPEFRPKKQGL